MSAEMDWSEWPHEPCGLHDDQPWVSFSHLRVVLNDELQNELLGTEPRMREYARRVMATLREHARKAAEQ